MKYIIKNCIHVYPYKKIGVMKIQKEIVLFGFCVPKS